MILTTDMSAKEIINDFKENYARVRKLLDEDSKNDPENEPYFSKYKAKDILNNICESLKNLSSDCSPEKTKVDAMLGLALVNIGIIDMETEDFPASEKILTEAATLLEPNGLNSEIITTLINVYNNLGILWAHREEPEKSKGFLLKAKELYEQFKCTLQMPLPIEHQVFYTLDAATDFMTLEKSYTLTLYYLAQVFGSLKQNLKSAIYCHVTLRRQLQYTDFDHIDWALNSATLSQFFAEQGGFYQSRHHLAAASTVLEQHEESLVASRSSHTNNEAYLAKVEILKHRSADVARCWAKYCLLLMAASRIRLMSDADTLADNVTDLSNLALEDSENIYGGDVKNLIFPDLEVSKYENKVGDKFLSTYEDAREVFLCCQIWLNKAKEYYKLDTLASDHIQLVQDSSQCYNYLSFFEEDDERRAKMHKRRVDMLEAVVKELNPQYYLQCCRQLWYELGESYSEILDIKLDKMNKEKPSPHALNKINLLCEKTIENYDHFLNSFKDKNGRLPEKLDFDLIRPVINAYAFIGRNSMKRIALDKSVQLSHIKKSYDAYKAVVMICNGNPDAATMMHEEFSLCQEMVSILPIKIKKLENEVIKKE